MKVAKVIHLIYGVHPTHHIHLFMDISSSAVDLVFLVGRRCYNLHLLCGGMVNLMTVLETTMARYAARLNLS